MGLDTVELIMSFEEQFGLEIPNASAEAMITVRDVRDFVVSEYARLGRPADSGEIFEKIRDITFNYANVRKDAIGLDTSFVDDLGLD